jgi:hypothetical protein
MNRRKLPIGIQDFVSIREDEYLYVDKTDFIYRLVQEGKVYFLSRPRRFGKSLLCSTLGAYLEGKKELFAGLALERLETEWTEYPVLRLDLNAETYNSMRGLHAIIDLHMQRWEQQYPPTIKADTPAGRFALILEQAHRLTGKRACGRSTGSSCPPGTLPIIGPTRADLCR